MESSKVSSLFAVQPTVLKPAAELPVEDTEENKPYKDPKLSIAQIKEREARTVFVGNVNIQCKHSTIKKHFAKYGTVIFGLPDRIGVVQIGSRELRD
jgi:RNA recognition motif-containing protein